jgi:hypothetical protein
MKKNLLLVFALVLVGVLSYQYKLMSFLLLAVIVLCLATLLLLGFVKAFRSSLHQKWFTLPLTVIGVCAAGVLIGLLRPLYPAVVSTGDAGKQLAYAYETDQADRMTVRAYLGILNDNMQQRDSIRLEQVNKLYKDNQVVLPMDKFHAAFIFHHSKQSPYFEIAQQLASEAAAAKELQHNYVVQWLAKATYDRWMVSLGMPQKFGTQDKFSVSVD